MRRLLGPVCMAAGPFLFVACLGTGLWICTTRDAHCLARDSATRPQCAPCAHHFEGIA